MAEKIFQLLYNSVQGMEEKLHIFLLEKHFDKVRKKNLVEGSSTLIILPIRINLCFQHNHKILYSIEMVQHLHINSQEAVFIKQYTNKKKLSIQGALIEFLKEIINGNKNIQTIIGRYLSKKKQVIIEVELLNDMVWQN